MFSGEERGGWPDARLGLREGNNNVNDNAEQVTLSLLTGRVLWDLIESTYLSGASD